STVPWSRSLGIARTFSGRWLRPLLSVLRPFLNYQAASGAGCALWWSRVAMTNVMTSAMTHAPAGPLPSERTLLIVEDDKSFLQRLARAMEGRGFVVTTAESVADGLLQVEKAAPAFAVVDMRLGDGNGLDVIAAMKKRRPEARAIILTGYGNITTAVNAVKLGAVDYLAKPVDADDVVAALLALDNRKIEPPENP